MRGEGEERYELGENVVNGENGVSLNTSEQLLRVNMTRMWDVTMTETRERMTSCSSRGGNATACVLWAWRRQSFDWPREGKVVSSSSPNCRELDGVSDTELDSRSSDLTLSSVDGSTTWMLGLSSLGRLTSGWLEADEEGREAVNERDTQYA